MKPHETNNPTQPTLSVVVPTFNRAPYLRATIDSVLAQDYPNIECIVIDAASTDGSVEILKSYGGRIRWVSEPDDGHADAINKGWRMAHGDILAWLNADDCWATPSAASQAVAFLEANPDVDVVYGDCVEIDPQGRRVGWTYLREWDLGYAVEFCDHCIPQPAAFIRRRILDKVGLLDTDFYQKKDHELWLRIALQGKIAHLPEPLACERNIKGLSFDGRTAAPACVQLTKHFYRLPGVPEALFSKQRRAVSNAYLRGLEYAYQGGPLWGLIFSYAARALATDPTNAARVTQTLNQTVDKGTAVNQLPWHVRVAWTPLRLVGRTLASVAQRLKQAVTPSSRQEDTLNGSDTITRDWVISRLAQAHGRTLIYESRESDLPLIAAMRGYDVLATAPHHTPWPYAHTRLRFSRDDIAKLNHPPGHYDLVISRSIHDTQTNGTLDRLDRCSAWVKPGGTLLITLAAPRPTVDKRLERTLDGFDVIEQTTWIKDERNRWVEHVTRDTDRVPHTADNAINTDTTIRCIVLRKHAVSNTVSKHTEAAA